MKGDLLSQTPAKLLRTRVLNPPDATQLHVLGLLYERAFSDTQGQTSVETLLRSNGSWAVLAEYETSQGRLAVGFLIGCVAADEAEILTIGVDPDWRQSGIGASLLKTFFAEAQQYGATQAFLEVAIDNSPAKALYLRAGFEEVGQRRNYYRRAEGARIDALVFRKDL